MLHRGLGVAENRGKTEAAVEIGAHEFEQKGAKLLTDPGQLVSRQSIGVSGQPPVRKNMPDTSTIGQDCQVVSLFEFLEKNYLRSTLRMLFKKSTQPVFRILLPAIGGKTS